LECDNVKVASQLLIDASKNLVDDPLEQFIGAFNSHGIYKLWKWATQEKSKE
jgi:hypothetical protein